MSKTKTPTGIAWDKAAPELIAKIKFVLQMAQNNRYSVSRIYAAHNAIFELKASPETCSTCLTSRTAALRKWWHAHAPKEEGSEVKELSQAFDEALDNMPVTGDKHENANDAALTKIAEERDLREREAHKDQLTELGIVAESSAEDVLEALEVLASTKDISVEYAAFIAQQINEVSAVIARHAEELNKVNPPEAIAHVIEEGALSLVFTPNADDAAKGVVAWSDGTKVKAGTYTSTAGVNIAVQVGGKASIK